MCPGNSTDGFGCSLQGDSTGRGSGRSSLLRHPARSFSSRATPQSQTGPWKLPEPWTPRTRPPLLGKLHSTQFPTAPTGSSFVLCEPEKCYPCSRLTLLPMFPVAHELKFMAPDKRSWPHRSCFQCLYTRRPVDKDRGAWSDQRDRWLNATRESDPA